MQKSGTYKTKKAKPINRDTRKRVELYVPGTLGFPDTFVTKLKYADTISVAPGAPIGQYTYRGNSLYDPDFTSGGHQPHYFDQLSEVYSRYRVLGAKITVSLMNNAGNTPLQVVIIPNTEVFAITSLRQAMEHPRAINMRLLGIAGYNVTVGSCSLSTTTILGLKGRELYDLDYSALTTSNPVNMWYFIVAIGNVEAINLYANGTIHIEYLVEMYDKIDVSPSAQALAISQEYERRKQRAQQSIVGPVLQVSVVDQPVQVSIAPSQK